MSENPTGGVEREDAEPARRDPAGDLSVGEGAELQPQEQADRAGPPATSDPDEMTTTPDELGGVGGPSSGGAG